MSKNKLGAYIQKLMTVIVDKEEQQFNKDLAYSELNRLNADVSEFLLKNRTDDEEEKEHNEKQLLLELQEKKNG
jgi:hypothetical protein